MEDRFDQLYVYVYGINRFDYWYFLGNVISANTASADHHYPAKMATAH